ncbi:ParA family protein [Bacillus suaedaesalsae]|uniref:AAA family ATPase n=1 Tax=Bacillus suaedaesalsae TaxID=2810349 RepID=A0ABS2DMB7_9BACI|nr:AAA family ATPase [Bacillus suaedaesalsae]MBM6619642.1 AAA family ATPase [Bacillus suaedaesalsae]
MTKATKLFVGNYKGGVGKTTSIYQIALHMVTKGRKVLLVDLDPQCSLSEICLSKTDITLDTLQDNECLNYIYDMWNERKKFPLLKFDMTCSNLVKQTKEGIHFIPSNIFYTGGGLDELALKLSNDFYDLLPLQQFFKESEIEKEFDYILFDCPPSNTMLTQGAFLLSDYYVIPSIIQTLSIRGVVHYIKTVDSIFEKRCTSSDHSLIATACFGEKPRLLGIFETLKKGTVNNTSELQELKDELKKINIGSLQSNYLFDTIIKSNEHIARNTANGTLCEEYEPLTDEIVTSLEGKRSHAVAVIGDKRWLR